MSQYSQADKAKAGDNQAKSMKALLKVTDTKLLVDIASHAQFADVCRAAVDRIYDPAELAKIATAKTAQEAARLAAIHKITDEAILVRIAKTGSLSGSSYSIQSQTESVENRLAALNRISSQAMLKDIAMGGDCPDVCKEAVRKLAQQSDVADVAKATYSRANQYAVTLLTDQDLLAGLIDLNASTDVQRVAVAKLISSDVLSKIAKTHKVEEIALVAFERIDDAEALLDIALTGNVQVVCVAAVEKIKNQAHLKRIAEERGLRSLAIMETTVARIADESVLALFDSELAVKQISSQVILLEIATNDKRPTHIRIAAAQQLTNPIKKGETLLEIARSAKSIEAAIAFGDDASIQDVYEYLALSGSVKAIEYLTEQDALEKIAMSNANSDEVRVAAALKFDYKHHNLGWRIREQIYQRHSSSYGKREWCEKCGLHSPQQTGKKRRKFEGLITHYTNGEETETMVEFRCDNCGCYEEKMWDWRNHRYI